MPLFYNLDGFGDDTARIAGRLAAIREALQNKPEKKERRVPNKNATETLLLATWNLKAFDGGPSDRRTEESYWYIAEIISHFDIVAIQEVGANLGALEKLRHRLGGTWKYFVSDVTEGKAGNDERLAFLFDRRKIRFSGIAGEIVIPPIENSDGKTIAPSNQLVRTPTIIGLEAGWFRFMLSTVHIIWGTGIREHPKRVAEIKALAGFLKERSHDGNAWSQNLILLGDFNIFDPNPSNAAFSAIVDSGFVIPQSLQNIPPTNVGRRPRFYDQIALRTRANDLEPTGRGGVFDFFEVIYREDDYNDHVPAMMEGRAEDDPENRLTFDSKGRTRSEEKRRAYYRNHWRRQQISDHLPMWLELKIDHGQNYLQKRMGS
jgi:endonuclease/exonuclease/phosphatase family metal-dependent hydrolase